MTTQDILRLRLYNQQLSQKRFIHPEDVVKWFGAMQAQDYPGAKWGLGQRSPNATDQTIEDAFNQGKILRTHAMRPTWHFVHPSDIRWMLKLTAPHVKRAMSPYNRKLELTDDVFKKTQKIITKLLVGNKALTRQEIKIELTNNGITTNVQRLAHIAMEAELDGVICSGPIRGKQFTYMLLEERASKTKMFNHDEALAELTKRYFQSHGPATLRDFVWWSGLPIANARKGIELNKSFLVKEELEGKVYWFHRLSYPMPPISTTVFLFPNYDEYGIAYTEREAFFKKEYNTLLNLRGSATFQHLIVYKAKMIGTWKRTLKRDTVIIETKFFTKPQHDVYSAFVEATKKFGEFLHLSPILG